MWDSISSSGNQGLFFDKLIGRNAGRMEWRCRLGSRWQLRQFDVPGKTEFLQRRDSVPVHVNFVPGQAMLSSLRRGVVIVMPAFPKSQDGNPETVGRSVPGKEAARTPHVRR